MDVRRAAEVPDKRRALQSPDVPHAVVAQVAFLVEGQRAAGPARPAPSGSPALRRDPTCRYGSISFWSTFCSVLLLVGRELRDRNAGELARLPLEADALSSGRLLDQGHLLLLAVEHAEDLVGRHRLVPEDVARVARLFVEAAGGVAVEDRAAKGQCSAESPSQRRVMCRPVITNSNLPAPARRRWRCSVGAPARRASSLNCLSKRACQSGWTRPSKISRIELLLLGRVEVAADRAAW